MKKYKIILSCVTVLGASIFAENIPPSAEAQKALTPDIVLADLMAGNKRFVNTDHTAANLKERLEITSKGQYPKAYILSCVDSRVPVELVFDQGIGDIFVGRVAGNIEGVDQLGSMEFASAAAGVKLIMVLGHEACGAVKGACDDVKLGNLTDLLAEIKPSVEAVKGFNADEKNSKNEKFVAAVIEENVHQTIADIRKKSPVLADLEEKGAIKIVGGLYSLHTGEVTLLD